MGHVVLVVFLTLFAGMYYAEYLEYTEFIIAGAFDHLCKFDEDHDVFDYIVHNDVCNYVLSSGVSSGC